MAKAVVISDRGVVLDIPPPPITVCPIFTADCVHCPDSISVSATVDVPQWGFGGECSAQSISHSWTLTKADMNFCEGDVESAWDCRYGNVGEGPYVRTAVDGWPGSWGQWVQGGMGQACSIQVQSPFLSNTCFGLPQNLDEGRREIALCSDVQPGWFTGMRFATYVPEGAAEVMVPFGSFTATYEVLSDDGFPVNDGCPVPGTQTGDIIGGDPGLEFSITVTA